MGGVRRHAPWWVLCVFGSACAQVAGESSSEDTTNSTSPTSSTSTTESARSDAVGGASFTCTGGVDPALRCTTNVQYCEQTTDGSTSIAARCVALPATCYDDPCDTCLSRGRDEIVACRSTRFQAVRQTTVTVRH